MRFRLYYTIWAMISFLSVIQAQTPRYLNSSSGDSVFVRVESGQILMPHKIKSGQTLYALAKYYGTSVSNIHTYNNMSDATRLVIGQTVLIPLVSGAILTEKSDDIEKDTLFVPVYYKVKSGESLYKIAISYFDMSISTLKERNELEKDALRIGKKLHIGWFKTDGVPDSIRNTKPVQSGSNLASLALQNMYSIRASFKTEKLEEGAAVWRPSGATRETSLYVLHRTAPIGTILKIYSPLKQRTIYAKVAGNIPDTDENRTAILVVSPAVARALGIIDPKFFVKISYY